MSVNLTGRTALVTGAASGFGRTIALGLLEAGARVALTDISEAHLKGVTGEVRIYGRQAIILVSDLGDHSDVRRLVAPTVDSLGHIVILVTHEIGSASCRGRVGQYVLINVMGVSSKNKRKNCKLQIIF